MSDAVRTEQRGGLTVNVCVDCHAWAHDGQALRHSRRCDTPSAQPPINPAELTTPSARKDARRAQELSVAEIKRRGRDGSGLTPDQIVDARARGLITADEAMNRDD